MCACARAHAPRHACTAATESFNQLLNLHVKVKHLSVCVKAVSQSRDVQIFLHRLQNHFLKNPLGEAVKPTNDARHHSEADKSREEAEGASSHHGARRPGPPADLCLRW